MNSQVLINNLKHLKRRLIESPEVVRDIFSRLRGPMSDWGDSEITSTSPARPYRTAECLTDVSIVTPAAGHYMTTFFDVNPFSPSGRYLAVTQVPFIDRLPIPGDPARVCVIDLNEERCRVVYRTVGWGAQLGANVQWGEHDGILYCNDVVEGRATGVRIDLSRATSHPLDGPIYGLSPDARYSYSPNIEFVNALIPGYGVPEPLIGRRRQKERLSTTDGIWRTDLSTGKCNLLVSLSEIVKQLPNQHELRGGTYNVFHVKVNPTNDRLFLILFSTRVPGRVGTPVQLVTMNTDGSNVRLALPDTLWRVGGHHPNWTPDGEHIVMNLKPRGEAMTFVRFRYDGAKLERLAVGRKGSGHPSLDPKNRFLITDSYVSEGFKDKRNDVPLRLINLATNEEQTLCWVHTKGISGPRRIDPHPVWSSDGCRIAFNGVVQGYRQVLIANIAKNNVDG